MLKVVMLLCQMCDIKSSSRGIALAPNRHNSVPCTVRTSIQRSCYQRVRCLQWSITFAPANGLIQGCYQPSPEVWIVWVNINNQNEYFFFRRWPPTFSISYVKYFWGQIFIYIVAKLLLLICLVGLFDCMTAMLVLLEFCIYLILLLSFLLQW